MHGPTAPALALRALRRYPDRFAGVCLVDPLEPEAARKLEYEVRARGFSGIRLRPRLPPDLAVDRDAARAQERFSAAARRQARPS